MSMITRKREALRAIRRQGYLNEFLSRDLLYRAHSVPGGENIGCPVISGSVGEWLIRDGLVVKVGERHALGGRSTLVRWYQLAPKQLNRGASKNRTPAIIC